MTAAHYWLVLVGSGCLVAFVSLACLVYLSRAVELMRMGYRVGEAWIVLLGVAIFLGLTGILIFAAMGAWQGYGILHEMRY